MKLQTWAVVAISTIALTITGAGTAIATPAPSDSESGEGIEAFSDILIGLGDKLSLYSKSSGINHTDGVVSLSAMQCDLSYTATLLTRDGLPVDKITVVNAPCDDSQRFSALPSGLYDLTVRMSDGETFEEPIHIGAADSTMQPIEAYGSPKYKADGLIVVPVATWVPTRPQAYKVTLLNGVGNKKIRECTSSGDEEWFQDWQKMNSCDFSGLRAGKYIVAFTPGADSDFVNMSTVRHNVVIGQNNRLKPPRVEVIESSSSLPGTATGSVTIRACNPNSSSVLSTYTYVAGTDRESFAIRGETCRHVERSALAPIRKKYYSFKSDDGTQFSGSFTIPSR